MQVLLISLGCPKNLVDSEIILGILQEHGFVITSNCFEAEIALVNTCAFIQEAKQEAIDTIFELAELKKQGSLKVLIVCGCLAQRYKYELTDLLGEVDAFVGTGSIGEIDKIIKSCLKGKRCFSFKNNHYLNQPNFHRVLLTPGHYAYIKIADGCDNACSYCVIPQIRGRYCSRNIESIAREAEFLSQKGVKEIILVSQDNTFYGKDIYGKYCLDVLLKELVQIKRLHWIRILYAYPNNITDNLIKVVAREQKICKYLDLPIQHINDRILQLMRRHITGRQIKDLIFKL
ncbi:MAG: 30S ribosomal protein S12 methylthiotransferase RimO, partial [Candidatus Omnitrophota bacterium]